jgi:hypothetical protein
LRTNNISEYTTLLVAIDIEVEVYYVGDSILVWNHTIKNPGIYSNMREIECFNERLIYSGVVTISTIDKSWCKLNSINSSIDYKRQRLVFQQLLDPLSLLFMA